jgi:hypothetical protein
MDWAISDLKFGDIHYICCSLKPIACLFKFKMEQLCMFIWRLKYSLY